MDEPARPMGTEAEYVSNPHSLCTPSPVDSRRQPARIARVRTVVADLPARAPEAWRCRVKHRLDFALALFGLAATAPVIGLAWALVKLTSRGPGFYSQERVGRFGRVFTIYKIRTMFHDCEADTGPKWSEPGDPRITPVGAVLRAAHLDELPQLWNILKGEMSLIGPRPERPEIAAKLQGVVPNYDRRLAVRPGISGYAQVYLPADTSVASVQSKIRLDLFYISNLSLWLDAKIIARTCFKICGLVALSDLIAARTRRVSRVGVPAAVE
jgi:lipopolysaccharide/colanic/teichoic acid biosynthesis glycosyltransferase